MNHIPLFLLLSLLLSTMFVNCGILNDEYNDECSSNLKTWTLSMPDTGYTINPEPFNDVAEYLNNSWEYTYVYISSDFNDSRCSEYILRYSLTHFDNSYINYSVKNDNSEAIYEYRHTRSDTANYDVYSSKYISPLLEETNAKVIDSNGDRITLKAGPSGHAVFSEKYGVLYQRIVNNYSQYNTSQQIYKLLKFNNKAVSTDAIVNSIINKLATIDLINRNMVYIDAASFSPGQDGSFEGFPVGNTPIAFDGFYASKYEVTNQQAMEVFNYGIKNQQLVMLNGDLYLHDSVSFLLAIQNPEWGLQHGIEISNDTLKVTTAHNEHPLTCVTWYGAAVYCNLLSEKEKLIPSYNLTTWEVIDGNNGYRLPYELEWEYIAGNKGRTKFPWGQSADSSKAHYNIPVADTDTKPVGSFPAGQSESGIYDLSGNVWEWVNDWYFHFPEGTGLTNLKGPSSGTEKVRRGGSYFDTEIYLSAASRSHTLPEVKAANIGFRVVRNTHEYR